MDLHSLFECTGHGGDDDGGHYPVNGRLLWLNIVVECPEYNCTATGLHNLLSMIVQWQLLKSPFPECDTKWAVLTLDNYA